MITFKSKEQMDKEKKAFTPLIPEDYELKVSKVEPSVQQKYQATPDENGQIPTENILNIVFDIIGFKDGEPAIDAEGKPVVGRKLFFTGRPDSMGFLKDGTASKTRALVAYATDQEVNGDIHLDSWDELLGKTVYAEVIDHISQKGNKGNKIARFIAKRKRPRASSIPVIENEKYDDGNIDVTTIPF